MKITRFKYVMFFLKHMAEPNIDKVIETLKNYIGKTISETELKSMGEGTIPLVIKKSYAESGRYNSEDDGTKGSPVTIDRKIRSFVKSHEDEIERILDMGCANAKRTLRLFSNDEDGLKGLYGNGQRTLYDKTFELYGIEFPGKAAEAARRSLSQFRQGDFSIIKYASEEFDVVSLVGATFACVPFESKREQLLANVYRQLKRGGYFILTCSHGMKSRETDEPYKPGSYLVFAENDREAVERPKRENKTPRLSYIFNRDSLISTVKKPGFSLIYDASVPWNGYERRLYLFKKI